MSQMICGKCYRYGIYWRALGCYNDHTFCPHCGGINCHQIDDEMNLEDSESEN